MERANGIAKPSRGSGALGASAVEAGVFIDIDSCHVVTSPSCIAISYL
jgi:hypothetical protein